MVQKFGFKLDFSEVRQAVGGLASAIKEEFVPSPFSKDRALVEKYTDVRLERRHYEQYSKNFPAGEHLHSLYSKQELDAVAVSDIHGKQIVGAGLFREMFNRGLRLDPKLDADIGREVKHYLPQADLLANVEAIRPGIEAIAPERPKPDVTSDAPVTPAVSLPKTLKQQFDKTVDFLGDVFHTSKFAKTRAYVDTYAKVDITRDDYDTFRDGYKTAPLHKVYGDQHRPGITKKKRVYAGQKHAPKPNPATAHDLLKSMMANGLELTDRLKGQMSPDLQVKLEPTKPVIPVLKEKSILRQFVDNVGDTLKTSDYAKDAKIAKTLTGLEIDRDMYESYRGKGTLGVHFSEKRQKVYHGNGYSEQIAAISKSYSAVQMMVDNGLSLTPKMIDDIPYETKTAIYTPEHLVLMREKAYANVKPKT